MFVFWMVLMEPVNALACWWPCWCRKCGASLQTLLIRFEIFEMQTCLGSGSQLMFRYKWRNLGTASLLLPFIGDCSCVATSFIVYWIEYFVSGGQLVARNFLVLRCYGNVCNWIPRKNWPPMEWFCNFLVGICPVFVNCIFAWTEICKSCSILIVFWRHRTFQ